MQSARAGPAVSYTAGKPRAHRRPDRLSAAGHRQHHRAGLDADHFPGGGHLRIAAKGVARLELTLGERLRATQRLGLLLAEIAVVLVTV